LLIHHDLRQFTYSTRQDGGLTRQMAVLCLPKEIVNKLEVS